MREYNGSAPSTRHRLERDMVCKNRHAFRKGDLVYKHASSGRLRCPFCDAPLERLQ